MGNRRIARKVKGLRKAKGLSQVELAKKSGLSLRTVQRVEKGGTKATGETLIRISNVLEITLKELIDFDSKKEIPKKTIKTKYEYLHIFDNKLAISKNTEINDLAEDYGKSVNNVFKTLMVFFIGILIFTALAGFFYNIGKTDLSMYSGSFALLFLVVAFNTIIFTSGSSLIKMENISKIIIRKNLFNSVVVILHKESGRLKERFLLLEKNQVESVKDSLLLEKIIEEKNIKFNYNSLVYNCIVALVIIVILFVHFFRGNNQTIYYYSALILFLDTVLLIKMMMKLIKPLIL